MNAAKAPHTADSKERSRSMKAVGTLGFIVLALAMAIPATAKDGQFKFRGIWAPASSFASREAADKLLDQCKRAKLNVILPNVMVHGGAFHKTTHYLHTVAANDKFDPLAYLIAGAHASGIQVHPWYNVYYEGVKGLEPAKPEWLCTDIDGKRMDDTYFLSPQVPGVNDYLLSVMKDGLAYDVDGLHLDYIRYFGTSFDYSDAGRAGFITKYHFDPKDFLDHGERIVAPEKDPFPVRVLHAQRHLSREWEVSYTESLMNRSGVGFSFISEKPENVDALRVPGALVLSVVYNLSPEMTAAVGRYVDRGGCVLCIDGLVADDNPKLLSLFGVKPGRKWLASEWRKIEAIGNDPLADCMPVEEIKVSAEIPTELGTGVVVSKFETGEPAVIVNRCGKGLTALVTFSAAKPTSDGPSKMVRGILRWMRARSGVTSSADPMATKRMQWIRWRADCITDMVRKAHDALKAKNPKLPVSVAGGFNPSELTLIYRDSRQWLREGLVDVSIPMDYYDSLDDLRHALEMHRITVPRAKMATLYPGLGLYTSKTVDGKKTSASQDASVVADQLKLLRDMGLRGFCLFCSAQLTDDQIKVLVESAR